ncbi:bifunctional phosphoribosylaminoimidazolecarboxamide formyltransferase/IMP cyclohydrolase [Rhodoflexus caldus]|uniref:bifunctional phosphoribosylaminoimidazolecarboxamide formyltransferase/IMP cyclohydrolase n=1 Tax=Rhodoflexus caldus TaxID=2891236 RepID=UPI002029D263|nr:bifunctional phosphoribosylaminoimidazolecarboxamide formyltransferase/IMP cyclohydrolase [Rhodoflexus caldus]
MQKKISSALVSVYYKDHLEPLLRLLHQHGVQLYSTGGTQQFIESLKLPVTAVEDLTGYPSIFGGRVKTLHPKVFGGILHRRDFADDRAQAAQYEIPAIDMVIVDLYPFEETVASGAAEADIIEKIDIGGISLIRAAAKNFSDVLIVSSREQYKDVYQMLSEQNGTTTLAQRRHYAAKAFDMSSHYDTAIFNYFNRTEELPVFKQSLRQGRTLRYGENPHQKGYFFGNLDAMFDQLNGKELSYNNLVDIDAAVKLIAEFGDEPAFAILKHTNACGAATAGNVRDAYLKALQADPVSAFGGVLVTNKPIDLATAKELDTLFFEVLIAPLFYESALPVLKTKKNRILLQQKITTLPDLQIKTLLNGIIAQDRDAKTETAADLKTVTKREPTAEEVKALLFANKLVKHAKSNTIVLAQDGQLFASGVGQTSRVDALRQAIEKAKHFGFDLSKAVMASDAFFPFPDCVEIAHEAGIRAVIQPGGSIKDADSIAFCDAHDMAMVFTGVRHFLH